DLTHVHRVGPAADEGQGECPPGPGQLWVEGPVRLRPGQPIELIGRWPGLGEDIGRARVVTWRIVRLTSEGPLYRGCCRLDG
ncbi:MAG: hypothetical protein WCQ64_05775, partial [Acidobacteriota bacterium]